MNNAEISESKDSRIQMDSKDYVKKNDSVKIRVADLKGDDLSYQIESNLMNPMIILEEEEERKRQIDPEWH